ncbi:MAG: methylated-DNA--[protein]-cysteine S-methyltransferase [Planctomycetes bacterium]|nr:methylated-DNA--[protein]-cysteine S-methyltransferase [Planctomycetota bacterium]
MQSATYGALVDTDKFGDIGFSFDSHGRLLELSWRKSFLKEVRSLEKVKSPCPSLTQLKIYLADYLSGGGPQFPGEYVFPQAAEFSTKVYKVVENINVGQALSYKEVAEFAGSPKAFRAVGNIMSKNPVPLVIP